MGEPEAQQPGETEPGFPFTVGGVEITLPGHLIKKLLALAAATLIGAAGGLFSPTIKSAAEHLPFGPSASGDKKAGATPAPSVSNPPNYSLKIEKISGEPSEVPCPAVFQGGGTAPDGWTGVLYAIDEDADDEYRTFEKITHFQQSGKWRENFWLINANHHWDVGIIIVPTILADYLSQTTPSETWSSPVNPPGSSDNGAHQSVTRSSKKCPQ